MPAAMLEAQAPPVARAYDTSIKPPQQQQQRTQSHQTQPFAFDPIIKPIGGGNVIGGGSGGGQQQQRQNGWTEYGSNGAPSSTSQQQQATITPIPNHYNILTTPTKAVSSSINSPSTTVTSKPDSDSDLHSSSVINTERARSTASSSSSATSSASGSAHSTRTDLNSQNGKTSESKQQTPPSSSVQQRPPTHPQQQQHNSNGTHPTQPQPPRPGTSGSPTPPSTNNIPKPPSSAVPSTTPPSSTTTAGTPSTPSADKTSAVSHYAVGKTIGEGTFGKVKAGIHKLTGLPVAIKILEKERIVDLADVERVKREIHILTRVRHPNVIRLFEVIDSPRHIFLIMQHCSGGELFDYIVAAGRVKEEEACRFFHEILNGTDYFHNKSIIHRDLKPENLLLDSDGCIKIVDFGLGNVVKPGKLLKTACGSPCYAAPEMISGKKYVGPGCDLWSLGVILFALLCGYLPFEDANTARLYEKIMNGEYELPDFLSSDAKDLLQKLLTTDPRKRFNAEQVRRHVWYTRLSVGTDPAFGPGDADAPIVPGPQASGKKVSRTISGQAVDDEIEIDQDLLRHMISLGYHPGQVSESVQSNRHDHFAATYHLLMMKKGMTSGGSGKSTQQSKSNSTTSMKPTPPAVPRIPTTAGGSTTGPSAPVAVHHPQPPTTQRPSGASRHGPTPPSAATVASVNAQGRVQSAGHVRPNPPAATNATAAAQSSSARPNTSYNTGKPDASSGVSTTAAGQQRSSVSPQPPASRPQTQASNHHQTAWETNHQQHRPPSSHQTRPNNSSQPQTATATYKQPTQGGVSLLVASSNNSNTPSPVPPPPTTQRQVSTPLTGRGSGGRGAKVGNAAAAAGSHHTRAVTATSLVPTVPQTHYATEVIHTAYPISSPRPGSNSGNGNRPMTGRGITGSTGGVSHRLYFPPSERAAQELALASNGGGSGGGTTAPSSRPGTSHSARPGSSAMKSRPGTSHAVRNPTTTNSARPPSGQRNQPRSPAISATGYQVRNANEEDWAAKTAPISSSHIVPTHTTATTTINSAIPGSSFNAQLSAMSFKSSRSIMDELARVLQANGMQFSVLPPSGAAGGATNSIAKHGFVPGNLTQQPFVSNLAPISISSLRPQARGGSDELASTSAANQVIEVRSGPNRFQFHVGPMSSVSGQMAKQLAAELDGTQPQSNGGLAHNIRVKRVLGDAQSFRDLITKILPQLKI